MIKCINGWTKERMIKTVNKGMKDHKSMGTISNGYAEKCRYKASDGNKCAVGCFIPDNEYRENLEGRFSINLPSYLYDKYFPLDKETMSMFQRVHDGCFIGDSPREACVKWIEKNIEGEI